MNSEKNLSLLPRIVMVGRPNVGKSTLFNRLVRGRRAITHDRPGITRDRLEGVVRRSGRRFCLVDTGGIRLSDAHAPPAGGPEENKDIEGHIFEQALIAARSAAGIALVTDGRAGLLPQDEHLLARMRRFGLPVLLVVNKVDSPELEDALTADFHATGLPVLAVSGEHGYNVRALADILTDMLPPGGEEAAREDAALRLSLLGRPNVGKSSLINALAGQTRMIVSEHAGTTRDSVDVRIEKNGLACIFVDTAGVRRPSRVTDAVEAFSVDSALKSSAGADVTLLMMDAAEGVTQQDKRLLGLLHERKTPFLVLVNKMDLAREQAAAKKAFRETLDFCGHVPLLFISALKRRGLEKILPTAGLVHEQCGVRIGTGVLNRAMREAIDAHQPPVVRRTRAKFFYLTQAESNPPTFVFFVNDARRVPESYIRYLEKALRRIFGIAHAPMRVRFRSSHRKNS
jgi:GTP-binding protein